MHMKTLFSACFACFLWLAPLSLPAQDGWQFWVTGGATVSLPTTANSANQQVVPQVKTDDTPDFYLANISRKAEGGWGWQGGVEMRYRGNQPQRLSFSWGLEGMQTAFGRTERVLIDPASPGAPDPHPILNAPRPVDTRLTYLGLPLQVHYALFDERVDFFGGFMLLGLVQSRQSYRVVREEVNQVNQTVSYFFEPAESNDLSRLRRIVPGFRVGLGLFPHPRARIDLMLHYLSRNTFLDGPDEPPVTPGLEVRQQVLSVRVGWRLL
jgi:hypothetical protein